MGKVRPREGLSSGIQTVFLPSPKPLFLLTNDSGMCHFIFYMWTLSLTLPPTDHSESKKVSWGKPESRGLTAIEFFILRERSVLCTLLAGF